MEMNGFMSRVSRAIFVCLRASTSIISSADYNDVRMRCLAARFAAHSIRGPDCSG